MLDCRCVGLRTCTVSYWDLKGVQHVIEVMADSLYEGLRVFRENHWIDEVGRGQTMISVVVRHPEIQHNVRVQDFELWLESQGRTPAEVSLKGRLRGEALPANILPDHLFKQSRAG